MIPSFVLFLAWVCPCDASPDQKTTGQVEPPTRVKTLAECKKLSREEYEKYIEQLGNERNLKALEELCSANYGYAITVYTQILDAKRAIRFCTSFPVGSYQWENAFWGLSSHRKTAVIKYVKSVCLTKDPWARGSCYSLCLKAGWDDLIENAKRDVDNETPMLEAIGDTLGRRARRYLELLPEVQKRLNQGR